MNNETILVVGGAGYIGSHMVKMLLEQRYKVVTLDDLSTGFRGAVLGGEFVQGDLGDSELLNQLFARYEFDSVMHFAAFMQVGESVIDPSKYYRNNVSKTLNLLDVMVTHHVNRLIFSSSAAVFGEPKYLPIDEDHAKAPINPYGLSKLMIEQILQDFDRAYGLKSISLRYFNAAGADPDGQLGPRYPKVTNLIPVALKAASRRAPNITVFGGDYRTSDGTCVRDYIHVTDLCQAHLLALQHLSHGGSSAVYNLGNGKGFSVKQVIEMAQEVSGRNINVAQGHRRPGDPASLVADATRAQSELGWKPEFGELKTIIEHAWHWEKSQAGIED